MAYLQNSSDRVRFSELPLQEVRTSKQEKWRSFYEPRMRTREVKNFKKFT